MKRTTTRREFIGTAAAAAAGMVAGLRSPLSAKTGTTHAANEKLDIAVVGLANQGEYNLNNVAGQNIVALCDVDEGLAAKARRRFPQAKFYADFRRMLDQKGIDAVVVATPDHTHAPVTMAALRAGKHVYCEKPLTHTVYEARQVTELAAKQGVATQIGTQIHARSNYRRVVELIKTGAVGAIDEIHVWMGSGWTGGDRPKETPPIPDDLHWDLWIGPAPYRPYHPNYHPRNWRGWWAFGGGTLADMACHYLDLPHWALDLRHVVAVEAEGPPVHPESAPKTLKVRWEYPARGELPPVKLTWHQGLPKPEYVAKTPYAEWGAGVVFVGKKGLLVANYNEHHLLPAEKFKDFERPKRFIPESIGHHAEWIHACKTGAKTTCSFDYSGPLTETVLLGNVAYRSGKRIEWDHKAFKITNAPEAARFLRREYRKGWEL